MNTEGMKTSLVSREVMTDSIEPNVLPIRQGHSISKELHEATGQPGWNFDLDEPGLRFAAGEEPVAVRVPDDDGLNAWTRCDRLSDRGPDDRVFELDTAKGRVTFGNGVNGRIPPTGAQVLADYAVSDGDQGNVARNRLWSVTGIEGVFGVNLDPVAGGASSSSWLDQRREARSRLRDDHPLVSSADVVKAAMELPLLDVARAWVLPPTGNAPRTGAITLVAMRNDGHETRRWLDAVRRRLAGRIPLATRLVVTAPRYVAVFISATLVAAASRNPGTVKNDVEKKVGERLAPLAWHPGVSVTRRDVSAWLRSVDGVREVVEVRLNGGDANEIPVSRGGLPLLDLSRSTIVVRRTTP
jgi:predicted phage baseplate assembly protein